MVCGCVLDEVVEHDVVIWWLPNDVVYAASSVAAEVRAEVRACGIDCKLAM